MDEFEAKRLDTIIQLLANIDARLEQMGRGKQLDSDNENINNE